MNSSVSLAKSPQPDGQKVGDALASFLSARHEQIVSDWIAAVNSDAKVEASEPLTYKQLRDHIPVLLDDLNETLSNAFDREIKERASYTAAIHGLRRWQEGYDICELLRELALLRAALIPHLLNFTEMHPEFGGASTLFVTSTLHRFLDNSMRISVEQFLASQERAKPGDQP